MREIVIELPGNVPSKKNSYTPNSNGRGMHKSPELQAAIDAIAIFVPGEVRDLKLKNPRIEVFFQVTRNGEGADQDGKYTCILDILVQMGVLVDDNIRNCNGVKVLHPVTTGDCHQTRIVLTPAELDPDEPATRYSTPRRQRKAPLASLSGSIRGLDAPALAQPGTLEALPEIEDDGDEEEDDDPWAD